MNFKKLQNIQVKLDKQMGLAPNAKEGLDTKFNKSAVALSVSISEIAITSEHFHSGERVIGKIDGSRFYKSVSNISGEEDGLLYDASLDTYITPEKAYHLNLLEKCLNAFHHLLSVANQAEHKIDAIGNYFRIEKNDDTLEQNFLFMQNEIGDLKLHYFFASDFDMIVDVFFIYIDQLGITADELEKAYYDKTSHLVVMEG